jgi:Rod binding domain-containing protein
MTSATANQAVVSGAHTAAARAERLLGPAVGTRDAGKVAREFAGVFYSMMAGEMQKTVPSNEYFGSSGEEVFRSLWVDELGRLMAERRGDPLAESVRRQIEKSNGVRTEKA